MPYDDEFPLLSPIGLYAANIRGDGNCLFNALSDQLYGVQDQHTKIRSRVIDHMRTNADDYKVFLEVYPGGGTRRNPKRKNAGSATAAPAEGPSPAEVDRVFEEHLQRMARGGTWGDNMEIQAFAREFDTNVQIYQRELAYVIQAPGGSGRPYAQIAYHIWEHYSSIRNIEGPHSGPPNVTPKALDPAAQQQLEQEIRSRPYTVPAWQVESLWQACPTIDRATLTHMLEETKGDIDTAFERLMAADEHKSVSSQQSSSVEREPDSDDESVVGPNKRQDRRMSRTSKVHQSARSKTIAFGYEKYKDSLENLVNTHQTNSMRSPQRKAESSSSSDAEDDTWTPPPLHDGDTSSGSEYTPPPESEPPKIKIKLSMPKKDEFKQTTLNNWKPNGIKKKPVSARQRKDMQKQAQKQASKERKQAAMGSKKVPSSTPGFEQSNHPFGATSGMKTLYI